MPYQEVKTEALLAASSLPHDEVNDEHERDAIDPPASRGADLLLSLTKERKPTVITPMDSMNASFSGGMTRICSNSSNSTGGSNGGSNGSSSRKDPPEECHQPHRLLYHSPIKVNSSSKQHGSSGSESSEIIPFPMGHAPAWSPSSLNGMAPVFHASFGRSPGMPIRQMNFDDDHSSVDCSSSKRSREEVEEKKEDADDSETDKPGKRLISPSSSNEKPEDDAESLPKGQHYPYPWGMPHHPPHHHPMYMAPPPHWPHKGYPPHAPYPPHFAAYPHYPPHPWAVYGPPPPPGAVHPPAPFRMRPENQVEKNKEADATKFPDSKVERCILVQNPVPNKYWSNTVTSQTERPLPDFTRLVNYPDFLSRGRHSEKAISPDGLKPCVMCGQMRRCSTSAPNENGVGTVGGRRPKQSGGPADEKSTTHIIPRQNKGVCTVCDVAVWLFRDADCGVPNGGGVEIKWCKGCKNFRPWSAFGEKGTATKCARCRQRQREKYAFQKNETSSRRESGDTASTA